MSTYAPSFLVTLPWPDMRLSANGREHWRSEAHLKRGAKAEGFGLAYEALRGRMGPFLESDKLAAVVTYYPPDRRKRDLFDNTPSACKPLIDGVFRALGVDDSQIRRVLSQWGEVTPGGKVIFELERIEP